MIFHWFIHYSELFFFKAYFGHCSYFSHSDLVALQEYLCFVPEFLPQHIGFAVRHDFCTQAVRVLAPHTYCPDLRSA